LKNLSIEASVGGSPGERVQIPVIQPLSVRKTGFHLTGAAPNEKMTTVVAVALLRNHAGTVDLVDSVSIPFRIVGREENHKETFISQIDGSVQYYGINPAIGYSNAKPAALFLSLHGAGVEAVNQSVRIQLGRLGPPRCDGGHGRREGTVCH